ncbi:hypothetical protein HAX54_044886 [Datura stramonium]|uniref:Uncharacterized protein n=1 Tax=Datura stramonium TaxID=4076 RepID=A0ABS8RP97_DATST|nr:hypothetical protein [Datura stramonium]
MSSLVRKGSGTFSSGFMAFRHIPITFVRFETLTQHRVQKPDIPDSFQAFGWLFAARYSELETAVAKPSRKTRVCCSEKSTALKADHFLFSSFHAKLNPSLLRAQ